LELPAIISLLLAFGVDANKPINRQRDMVHYNQDMWLQSSFGESCFGTAIRRDKSQDLWIVRMLLKMGANPNSIATERPKRTPLLAAIELQNLSLVKILISAGAEVNRTAAGVITRTPLQMAAELGNVEILEELLRNSAKVNALPADMYGATALQFAAIGGYVGIAKILLEIGADVDAAGARIGGRTALEAAAEHGRIDMLQLLLDYRAQIIGSGEEQYQRAVRFAQENGHLAVGRLLENILLASNDHEQTSPSEWMTWCS
jgi:ankyrin repeat protein